MQDGDKRCSCGAGCPTFGACMRGKKLQFDMLWAAERRFERDQEHYAIAVRQGIEPEGFERHEVDQAIRWSDENGAPYGNTG